ncbi:response regulator [Bordetella genomosp. 13]|uniref:Response regulator n=1 Tax=Bordetella genomosp. 13 TaxID=463040 RepID=A0A1W6Z911_9BORD|nr:response regulator [Bordetella genomosp. 13]ARP93821.1 response regulator [Bordetella genomosp. 13]
MTTDSLRDRRILIVEDEYLIAEYLQSELEDAGAVVAGMAANIDDALRLLENNPTLDAAILDVNLGGEMVFPLADQLLERGVPFIFTTGYDASSIPARYATAVRCEKPYNTEAMLNAIRRVIARRA